MRWVINATGHVIVYPMNWPTASFGLHRVWFSFDSGILQEDDTWSIERRMANRRLPWREVT